MKLNSLMLLLLSVSVGLAAEPRSEFETGRAYYTEGDFKKAAAHFQLALRANPDNAEVCYWMGMSYQALSDIATPFGGSYSSKARVYLTKAMELAPGRWEYRRELFDFLLDGSASRSAMRQAAQILAAASEADSDYGYMRWRYEEERRYTSSAEARVGRLILAGPQIAYRVGEASASAAAGLGAAVLAARPGADGISAVAGISAAATRKSVDGKARVFSDSVR